MLYLTMIPFFLCSYLTSGLQDPVPHVLLLIAGIACVFISLGNQISRWYWQAHDIERCKEEKKDKITYQKEAKQVLDSFKMYLADIYPEHEKSIFKTLKPDNVTIFMTKYPEIKSDKTLVALCNEIKSANSKIFTCDRVVNKLERQMAVRRRTMWLTGLPILPKED